MKKTINRKQLIVLTSVLLFLTMIIASSFKSNDDNKKRTIEITGTRFLFPLIEKWAAEYKKANPDVEIVIAFGSKNAVINASAAPIGKKDSISAYESVGKFALVPIVNANNPAWQELKTKGITKKDFLEIYFGSNSGNTKSFKIKKNEQVPINVYTRGACASATFTNKFGKQIKDLNNVGGKIDDDEILLEKVKNDTLAVAYNNLGFVYNLKTRKPKTGIQVIPIDINENGRIDKEEAVYDNLDNLIKYIETSRKDLPPTGNVTFIFQKENQDANNFVRWIKKNGNIFNHELGFLTLYEE